MKITTWGIYREYVFHFWVVLKQIQSYFKGNVASINYTTMLIFHGGINRRFHSHGEIPQPTQPFAFDKTRATRGRRRLAILTKSISDRYDPWTLPQELLCAAPMDHHGNFNVSRVVNLSVGPSPELGLQHSWGWMMTMFSTCFFGLGLYPGNNG